MNQFLWIFLGCLLMSTANSASFDCAKAVSKVEKLICANDGLSKLDEKMNAVYKTAMKGGNQTEFIRQEQVQWLQQRNGCVDVVCLTKAYANRLVQLSLTDKIQSGQTSSIFNPDDVKACREVAEHLNRNSMIDLRVQPAASNPSLEELQRIFEEEFMLYSDYLRYWLIDLNNDGILDHLLTRMEGSAHFTSVFARSGRKGAVRAEMGTDIEETGDTGVSFDPLSEADVLSVTGRNYIFDGNWLWNLTKDDKFQAVCKFEPIGKPIVVIKVGNENPVCPSLLASEKEIQYVSYSPEFGFGESLPDEERFNNLSRGNDIVSARMDIDNDGKLENVVRIVYVFPGGRGCSATNLAVTDNSATHIPDTKLNRLLLDEMASHPCGPSLDVLVHDGVTYVDAIQNFSYTDALDRGGHTLYRIKQDKSEKVCESRTRINVQPVGVSSGH